MTETYAKFQLDDGTVVAFEIDPPSGFQPASPERVVGKVRDALGPLVEAATVVIDKVKQAAPDEVEVKFGIKVTGKMDWMIAKVSTDANFEVKLVWKPIAAPTPELESATQVPTASATGGHQSRDGSVVGVSAD